MSRSRKDLEALEKVKEISKSKGYFTVHRYQYNQEPYRWACKKLSKDGYLKKLPSRDKKFIEYVRVIKSLHEEVYGE